MAENVRSIKEILQEMFGGKDAALEKLAKVRMTKYEVELWYFRHAPLGEISKTAKAYFAERFLGKELSKATPDEVKEALIKLDYAVNSCKKRCSRLVEELNQAMIIKGFEPIRDISGFLDWLTFCYEEKKDGFGQTIYELGYSFPLLIFYSDRNRKELWYELKSLMKANRMMPIIDICKIVKFKRRKSLKI